MLCKEVKIRTYFYSDKNDFSVHIHMWLFQALLQVSHHTENLKW